MSNLVQQESDQLRRAKKRVGTTLKGKYRIDRVLGIGGMAVVYAATHRNQAELAVKMLHSELSMHEDVCRRFLREGYAANSVKHPGVVMVVDDDIAEDGAAFLVMEMLRGDGVESLWEQKAMHVAPHVAVAIVDQLLDVLSAAHEKGIVHRDIKPANLFLTHEGVVKVLDFGIARARDALASGGNQTGTGMLLGTPAFMAPEQALAKTSEIDAQTDVWAAAATLFSLISGQFVHTGENAPQLLVNAATKPARSLSTVANAPQAVVDVVAQGLAFDKRSRFSSARVMQVALRDASRRSFGVAPSRELLAGEARRATSIPTAHVLATIPMDRGSAPTLGQPLPPPNVQSAPGQMHRPLGGTTAQPVSQDHLAAPRPNRSTRGAPIAFSILGLVVLLLSAGGLYEWRATKRATSDTVAASMSISAAATSAPALAVTPPTSASAAAPVVSATPSSATVDALHTRAASHTHAAAPPAGADVSRAPTSKPSAAKVSCDPPFFFDNQGRKVFKPECM